MGVSKRNNPDSPLADPDLKVRKRRNIVYFREPYGVITNFLLLMQLLRLAAKMALYRNSRQHMEIHWDLADMLAKSGEHNSYYCILLDK